MIGGASMKRLCALPLVAIALGSHATAAPLDPIVVVATRTPEPEFRTPPIYRSSPAPTSPLAAQRISPVRWLRYRA